MDEILQEIPVGESLVIGGDFNGHVGTDKLGYERVYGGYDFDDRNEVGESVLDSRLLLALSWPILCIRRDMII